MSVKVIVTDMDGTFLNDAKTYNQPRFMAQYQELKKRGIEFVVASGNQYYQLISFFPELKDEISFVAENGALVYEHGKTLPTAFLVGGDFMAAGTVNWLPRRGLRVPPDFPGMGHDRFYLSAIQGVPLPAVAVSPG